MTTKKELGDVLVTQQQLKLKSVVEIDIYKKVNLTLDTLYQDAIKLEKMVNDLPKEQAKRATEIANVLMPMSEKIERNCSPLEGILPDSNWPLPSYSDMLFVY